MAYQSIFTNGQLTPNLKTSFNYVAPPAPVQKFNLNSVRDVPTLNAALKAGHINQNQWMQRFKQIQSQTNGPKINTSIVGNLNPISGQSSLNQALNKVFIQSPKAAVVDTATNAAQLGKSFTAPTSTQAQRNSIINNQNALKKQANPQFNTKNPTGGNIIQRVKNDVVSAYQHANPFSGVHDANKLIAQTQQQYGLTPRFVQALHNANTSLTNKPLMGNTANAITELPGKDSNTVNRTQIVSSDVKAPNGQVRAKAQDTVVHEGLHQVWAANPKLHNQFAQAYNQSTDPGLQKYLQQTLNVSPNVNLSNFNKLPPALQDEVHSAAIHFYTTVNPQDKNSNALTKYYSQFLNIGQAQKSNSQVNLPKGVNPKNLQEYGDSQGNTWLEDNKGNKYPIGAQASLKPSGGIIGVAKRGIKDVSGVGKGLVSADKSLANTLGVTQAANILNPLSSTKSKQQSAKQIGKGILNLPVQTGGQIGNTINKLTGAKEQSNIKVGPLNIKNLPPSLQTQYEQTKKTNGTLPAIAQTALSAATDVSPLLGIKEIGDNVHPFSSTNKLIDSQKVANATKKANLADVLGNSGIKAAKTTQIPVEGDSTAIAGKVTPKPADTAYIKASNKLSDQYEKELKNIQTVQHPVTQKVLQAKLDTKYNALQQNLDDTYGKSSISFKGNPVLPKTETDSLPTSAVDKNPVTPFNSTRIPEQTTNKLPSPAPNKSLATTSPTEVEPKIGETTTEQGTKVSGSALNSEQRAVEKGLVSDLGDEKATYRSGSYKQEASKAVNLVNEQPEEAMKIATGAKPGDNTIHEVAVRRAVENKALQSGDVDTLTRLAQSSQHSATSEAAQRLGSEGFNAPHNSPVQAIREVQKSRENAILKRGEKTPEKVVASTVKDIKKTAEPKLRVSRQDWHSFIQDLQCK